MNEGCRYNVDKSKSRKSCLEQVCWILAQSVIFSKHITYICKLVPVLQLEYRYQIICTAWWQKNSYPCMSFCMSFCLVGYEFFCHQAVYASLPQVLRVSAPETTQTQHTKMIKTSKTQVLPSMLLNSSKTVSQLWGHGN